MAGPTRDRLVRAALASGRLPNRIAYASRAVINGFWLGVLSEADLCALDELYYSREPRYRADDWNASGLFGWETELVDQHFPAGGKVAVVGAGGGREVLALLLRGDDAVGYEAHPALVAAGRSFLAARGHPGALLPAPRDAFPDDAAPCDAAIVGWGTYSLIHGAAARRALLAQARRLLPVDGPLLVSYFERPALHREARWTHTLANAIRRVRGAPPVEPGDTLAPNRVHLFDAAELRAEAAAAGFEVVEQRQVEVIEPAVSYAAAVLSARP